MARKKGKAARSKPGPSSSSSNNSLAAPCGSVGLDSSSMIRDDSTPSLDVHSEVVQNLTFLSMKDPTAKPDALTSLSALLEQKTEGYTTNHSTMGIFLFHDYPALEALRSLSALLEQKAGKDIRAIIPLWAFEYKRLLLDYSREVRRETHNVMTNLVVTVGRDLSPHLNSLMGPWWFSQFDPVSEVSEAAKRSLQAAFPAQEKRLGALIMYTADIFIYLEENLKLTPQNMSNKSIALDELEEIHQQVISSSLLAWATLVDVLVHGQSEKPASEHVTAEPKHALKARATAICYSVKLVYLIDFMKSQNSSIKSAAYSLLCSLIKNIPQIFDEADMQTIGGFQEKVPACHPSMFEALVLFSKTFPGSLIFRELATPKREHCIPLSDVDARELKPGHFMQMFREIFDSQCSPSACAKSSCSPQHNLLDSILIILLDGSLVYGGSSFKSYFNVWPASNDEMESIEVPIVRALVSFLSTLFKDNIWGEDKAMSVFELVASKLYIGSDLNRSCLKIAPLVVHMVQTICHTQPGFLLEENMLGTIKVWLQRTLSFPPLNTWQTAEDMEEWFQLIVSCYPVTVTDRGKSLKVRKESRPSERVLLLDLFRKQRPWIGAVVATNELPVAQILLSKLIVVSISYCWKEFDDEDWMFVLSTLNDWISIAALKWGRVAEKVNDLISYCSVSGTCDVVKKLEHIVTISDHVLVSIATNALLSFSLISGLLRTQQTENEDCTSFLKLGRLNSVKDRILEDILRIFFSTGIAEAIARSTSNEAASVVAITRINHPFFWEFVASSVVSSSPQARDRAVRSIEFWGLRKGPISSLYAILFSSKAIASLQLAAFVILSTEPVICRDIIYEDNGSRMDDDVSRIDVEEKNCSDMEISGLIEKLPHLVIVVDPLVQEPVHVFLAWSLLLLHFLHLPSSPSKKKLIQLIRESENFVILDCLFQHIILDQRDGEFLARLSKAAAAAKRAITTGSLLFYVEPLWPIEPVKMASLAGAIYGLLLHVFPANVRGWFNDLESSTSSIVESFTRDCCSPSLIADELSQIEETNFRDANFSVRVIKSVNEVVATYTKDETRTDLVIQLPPSYPLRHLVVNCTEIQYISEVKQNQWLSAFRMPQSGGLAEAIWAWKNNFDKEFEGTEECSICHTVVYTANQTLPCFACKTCKKKCHVACIYYWFNASRKCTCPLCTCDY